MPDSGDAAQRAMKSTAALMSQSEEVDRCGSWAFDLETNNRFASDAFDYSFRQTPVIILRNEIEVSGDQLKLDA